MIQLATDPNASRSNWRLAPTQPKEAAFARKGRNGHPWPFISRAVERPVGPSAQQAAKENGS